jgi:ribose transport system ATP-binding protein
MIYITHRLDEVLEIADNVQVLRDGCSVLEARVATVDRQNMVSAMIGRDATAVARPTEVELGTTSVLSVSNLTLEREFSDVNLDIRGGEILALYGKIGSGTAEVAEALFGLHPATQGTVTLKSQPLEMTSPNAAIKQGIGFLPPDRQRSGSFAPRSVAENLAAPSWAKLARRGILSHSAEREAYERWRGKLNIRSTADSRQAIINLSGGNQQKVLLARWLERDVDLLLLVEPTRGVDVGARIDIYNAVRDLAKSNGLAVLVVTSDYEEVIQLSDRALVMVAGRITDELTGDAVTAKALTGASGG